MTRKHEANVKKSKWINFQLWVIAMLSFSYFMYEVSIYSEPKNEIAAKTNNTDDFDEPSFTGTVIPIRNVEPKPKVEPKPVTKELPTEPVKDDTPDVEEKEVKKQPIDKQPTTTDGEDVNLTEKNIKTTTNTNEGKKANTGTIYNPRSVEFLPVYPGCDKYATNDERAACFQKKIQRHVNRKFNDGLGEELGLKGRQRINLYFEIDTNGNISNIRARSAGKVFDLEKEAIRVAKLLPTMEPARAGNRKVKMSYTMPIVFDAR